MLILGGITAATGGLGLFSIFLIAAISGIEVYGAFAVVLAITSLVSNILKLGLDAHIMKHCPPVVEDHGPKVAREYLYVNASVIAGTALAALIVSQFLAAIFVAPAMSVLAWAISAAALAQLLKVVVATLLRALGSVLISQYFLRLGDILVFVSLLLIMWLAQGSELVTVQQLSILWALATGGNFFLTVLVFARLTGGAADSRDTPQFKAIFSELFYFSAVNAVATVLQTVDILVIGYLGGDTNVGIYSILKRSVNQVYVVVGLFQIQFWGQLSVASAKSDTATLHSILRRARKAVSMSLPLLCVLAAGLAYVLLIGAGVTITSHLILVCAVLMAAMVTNSLFLFAATLANLNGMERFVFLTLLSGAVVYIGLILLSRGDILIASIASFLHQIVVNSALAVQLYRQKSIHLFSTH